MSSYSSTALQNPIRYRILVSYRKGVSRPSAAPPGSRYSNRLEALHPTLLWFYIRFGLSLLPFRNLPQSSQSRNYVTVDQVFLPDLLCLVHNPGELCRAVPSLIHFVKAVDNLAFQRNLLKFPKRYSLDGYFCRVIALLVCRFSAGELKQRHAFRFLQLLIQAQLLDCRLLLRLVRWFVGLCFAAL